MQSYESNVLDERFMGLKKKIHFLEGVPAFEKIKEFSIVSNEEEAPFIWLRASCSSQLAFIMIDPFLIFSEYRPEISDEDVKLLEIESEEDVFIFSIVNICGDGSKKITTNLVSPVIINWKKQLGKQVILKNHLKYSVQYRIDNLEG